MTSREWKYLRKKYMTRKGYFKIHFTTHTFPMPKPIEWSNEPMGNFAMMIPKEKFKPYVHVEPYRNRSKVRFNLPVNNYPGWKPKKNTLYA